MKKYNIKQSENIKKYYGNYYDTSIYNIKNISFSADFFYVDCSINFYFPVFCEKFGPSDPPIKYSKNFLDNFVRDAINKYS